MRESATTMIPSARIRAHQERLSELLSIDFDEPWVPFFEQFFGTPGADGREVEAFQLDHCDECKRTAGQELRVRDSACATRRCTLRDLGSFIKEQRWAANMLDRLLPVIRARNEDRNAFFETVAELNEAISTAGCLTPSLERWPNAISIGASYSQDTLRARVHLGLFQAVAFSAGDRLKAHAGDMTRDELLEAVTDARERYQEYKERIAHRLLQQRTVTRVRLAEWFNVDPKTITAWSRMVERQQPATVTQWIPPEFEEPVE